MGLISRVSSRTYRYKKCYNSMNNPLLFKLFRYPGHPTQEFYHRYKYFVLILTFFCYLSYHASRKPLSIVKAELHKNCTIQPNPNKNDTDPNWCDWVPFDQDNYKILFSELDYGF